MTVDPGSGPSPLTSHKLLTVEYKCKNNGDYSIAILDMNTDMLYA